MNQYLIRRATKNNDDKRLKSLYRSIFLTEDVGGLAEVMYNHYPVMKKEYWVVAEEKASQQMVSAIALIPWTWEINGVRLRAAEMGLVGTLDEHRGRGLQKLLNAEFDLTLKDEQYDLAVIQGIPGFYHKFGYHYAVALENHINLPLDKIPGHTDNGNYTFRLADKKDIPFLMKEDDRYRSHYLLSSVRDEQHWEYMMSYGLKTDCGAEYWIMQDLTQGEQYYCKIPWVGFGTGLIVSEVSEDISLTALHRMLSFCRQKAVERNKPYIRFNLHNESTAAEAIMALGIPTGRPYAWQVKIVDKINFLIKLKPILEKRIADSVFKGYSGIYRVNFYNEVIDMHWEKGCLKSVTSGGEGESPHTYCIGNDLFPSLVLGHRSWEELQYFRPDASPQLLNILPTFESLNDKTGLLTGTLFPACKSWIYQQY
ncbi:MAG: GNAT family N-acetyltransferase [Bacteroidales bacterium]|nr:GNAT family N-acetyltransferase [Bacteroidales bacterium]MBN2762950.1 GNAT family N-acetyltransferase [Bacteroidales bacterium]